MSAPRQPHLQAIHHLLRYLKGTVDQGLLFPADISLNIKAYSDADWGSCVNTRRSTSGLCIFTGDALVSWKSKKQKVVSKSSSEAEYRALVHVTSELTWLNYLPKDFQIEPGHLWYVVTTDNHSAVSCKNTYFS